MMGRWAHSETINALVIWRELIDQLLQCPSQQRKQGTAPEATPSPAGRSPSPPACMVSHHGSISLVSLTLRSGNLEQIRSPFCVPWSLHQ